MKKVMMGIFFVCLTCCFLYADQAVKIKEGTYELTGNNDGSDKITYKGYVIISLQNDIYSMQWKIGPSQKQIGIALLTNDILSVAYLNQSINNCYIGVVAYKVISENQLEGKWTSGGCGYGLEHLVWLNDKIE